MIKKVIFIIVIAMTSMSVFSENLIRPFVSGSYSQILEQHKDKPFALVLWSLDCPSCYKELEMLGQLNNNNPNLTIILVSTDIEATEDELKIVLSKYNLANYELWVFRGDSDQRLRFEIDPRWYGELPRSYVFNEKNNKKVVSGILDADKLLTWIKY